MISAFDIAVVLVLVVSVLIAFTRGMTAMLLSLLAWGGALAATLLLWEPAAGWLAPVLRDPKLADFLAGPVVFIATLVVLRILAHMTAKAVREGPVGFLDRSLGALFGLLLGFVAVSASYLLLDGYFWRGDLPEAVRTARSRPVVAYGAAMLAEIGPDFLRQSARHPPPLRLPEKADLKDGARRLLGATGYRAEDARALEALIDESGAKRGAAGKEKETAPASGKPPR